MAKAFIAAVPLALALIAAVVVPVIVNPGAFGFDSWPSSPVAPREHAVVVEAPVASAAATPPSPRAVVRDDAVVARASRPRPGAPAPTAAPPRPLPVRHPAPRSHASAPVPAPQAPRPAATGERDAVLPARPPAPAEPSWPAQASQPAQVAVQPLTAAVATVASAVPSVPAPHAPTEARPAPPAPAHAAGIGAPDEDAPGDGGDSRHRATPCPGPQADDTN